jgi:iron complex outermembrane receptor protein
MGTTVPRTHFSFFRLFAALIVTSALTPVVSLAADNNNNNNSANDNDNNSANALQEVVVTGSLIPQSQAAALQTPVTVITNEDITAKGFTDIAEALERTTYATGANQNSQFVGGFTQAAKAISFFGLNPSYTKYLIDGRPIAEYPALFNGEENFVSVTGIPTVLVDHIDTLPGAQSSIYGSDAIAGVINIVMKKDLDGPIFDGRLGWTADGGGRDTRFGVGDGFSVGNFSFEIGGQYEDLTPIYGFQRPLTAQEYAHGSTPLQAFPYYNAQASNLNTGLVTSQLLDPAACANLAGQFNGSIHEYDNGSGPFCGSYRTGYFTLQNADRATQGYFRATYDMNDHLQVFVESLANHDVSTFNTGPFFFETADSSIGFFEDPVLSPGNALNLIHNFSPEEAGGINTTNDEDTNNTWRATIGASGDLWNPAWRYLTDFTYTQNRLAETFHTGLTTPITNFFSAILGPSIGTDAVSGLPEYAPNYGAFFSPVTPAEYGSFFTDLVNRSQTEESFARAQVTSTDLFPLPGGNAGLALQAEAGEQGWFYNPDPNFQDGGAYLFVATAGSGHRSRYAGSSELRLPVLSMLTLNVSGRYDDYRVAGSNVDKFTYDAGFEFKPIEQFLFRGRYGTAFKAPTLADEFQGKSGAFEALTDYYLCTKQGFTGSNLSGCPEFNQFDQLTTSGSPGLSPITAKVWDLGWVATPINRLTFTADYINWSIFNEIAAQDANKLLEDDAACLLGQLPATSGTCQAAFAQVQRVGGAGLAGTGAIINILDPKQNVSSEHLGVLIMGLDYKVPAGFIGEFEIAGSYENTLTHRFQQFPYDPVINDLNNPFFSSEFKTKDNLTITWTRQIFSSTLYVERYGKTPNITAQENITGYATPGGGDVGAWTLADLSVSFRPIDALTFTLAINNLFNTGPPSDHSVTSLAEPDFSGPYNNFNYNVFGRVYFVQARYGLGTK